MTDMRTCPCSLNKMDPNNILLSQSFAGQGEAHQIKQAICEYTNHSHFFLWNEHSTSAWKVFWAITITPNNERREENQDPSTLSQADPPELQPTCASPPAYLTSAWTSWSPSPRRPLLRQKSAKQTGKLGKTSDVLKTWINKLVILFWASNISLPMHKDVLLTLCF